MAPQTCVEAGPACCNKAGTGFHIRPRAHLKAQSTQKENESRTRDAQNWALTIASFEFRNFEFRIPSFEFRFFRNQF